MVRGDIVKTYAGNIIHKRKSGRRERITFRDEINMTSMRDSTYDLANQQGATASLAATFDFLIRNNIEDKAIVSYVRSINL